MLTIVDIIRQNDEHGTTNEPVIQSLCEGGGVQEVWLAANSSSIQYVVRYPHIRLVKVAVNASKSYRWLCSTWLTLKVLLANQRSGRKVLFLSATPLHYWLIALMSRISQPRSRQVFVFMHGELGYINQPVGLGQKLGAHFIQTSFKWVSHCKLTFVSIGFPIYKQLQQRFPSIQEHLVCIEIPATDLPPIAQHNAHVHPLRLGTFGVQSQDKNSSKIYDLAQLLATNPMDGYQLVTIGLAAKSFSYDQHPHVQHLCRGYMGQDYVRRDEFVGIVKSLDWALFFYDHNQKYGLVPSGIFYDCVNFCIPIVAMRSRVFEYYFDRYGPLGILCDSLEEMAAVVARVVQGDYRRDEFIRNIAKASEDMSLPKFRSRILELVA